MTIATRINTRKVTDNKYVNAPFFGEYVLLNSFGLPWVFWAEGEEAEREIEDLTANLIERGYNAEPYYYSGENETELAVITFNF